MLSDSTLDSMTNHLAVNESRVESHVILRTGADSMLLDKIQDRYGVADLTEQDVELSTGSVHAVDVREM